MSTLHEHIEKIIEEFDIKQRLFLARRYHSTEFNKWLEASLSSIAIKTLSEVRERMPEDMQDINKSGQPFTDTGWNNCRSQTLQNLDTLEKEIE